MDGPEVPTDQLLALDDQADGCSRERGWLDKVRTRCDVELLDTSQGENEDGLLVCTELLINDHRVWVPKGTQLKVTAGDRDAVVLELRVFPTSLTIRRSPR